MPEKADLRYITRHDCVGHTGLGWKVCMRRRDRVYEEQFTDAMHGSKEESLEAAIRFRDACLAELPPPAPIKFRHSKNKTGVVGVCYIKSDDRYGKRERFVATWPTKEGKATARRFNVFKYGYEGAFELAKKAREEGVLREFGVVSPSSPDPKPLLKAVGRRLGIKEKRTGFLGLLRIDEPREERQGWEVGVRRENQRYSRYFFADARYGSKTKALRAAKQYQKAIHDGALSTAPIRFQHKKNKTGVVGVALMRKRNHAGKVIEFYQAKWPTRAGKTVCRYFFVSKYGHDRAFELARQAREEGIVKEFGSVAVSPRSPAPLLTAAEGGFPHRAKGGGRE